MRTSSRFRPAFAMPTLDRRHRTLDHRRRRVVQDDAVRDLPRQLQHPLAERPDVHGDRRFRRVHGRRRPRLVQPLVPQPFARGQLPEQLHVLAHAPDRTVPGQPVPVRHDHGRAHAKPGAYASTAQVLQRPERHRRQVRVAQTDGQDARADPEALGARRHCRQHRDCVRLVDLRHPAAAEALPLAFLRLLDVVAHVVAVQHESGVAHRLPPVWVAASCHSRGLPKVNGVAAAA